MQNFKINKKILLLTLLGAIISGIYIWSTPQASVHVDASTLCDEVRAYETRLQRCEDMVAEAIDNGLESLEVFLENFRKDTIFEASECHIYAHILGRAVYMARGEKGFDPKTIEDQLPLNAAICAIKAYHGFFYEMLGEHGSERKLTDSNGKLNDNFKAFCDNASTRATNRKFQGETKIHCYIGVGYGAAVHYAKLYPGEEAKVVRNSIAFCEHIAQENCVLGVYEGISMMYNNVIPNNNLTFDREDPFRICRVTENSKYARVCLVELRSSIISYLRGNLEPVETILKELDEPLAREAMHSIGIGTATFYIMEGTRDIEKVIAECRKTPKNVQPSCIEGMVWSYARIEDAHNGAFQLCSSSLLTESEQERCFTSLYKSWLSNYDKELYLLSCNEENNPRKEQCITMLEEFLSRN